jgi:hypothetical protein
MSKLGGDNGQYPSKSDMSPLVLIFRGYYDLHTSWSRSRAGFGRGT